MYEEIEYLLRINVALGLVPVFVMIGVTRILARQQKLKDDVDKTKEEHAVFTVQMTDARERIVRLEDLIMKEGG